MRICLTIYLVVQCFGLFAQKQSVPVIVYEGKWNYWYKNGNPLASGDYTAVKTSISRGEIYVAKMLEGSWACRDMDGNEIACAEVEALLNFFGNAAP